MNINFANLNQSRLINKTITVACISFATFISGAAMAQSSDPFYFSSAGVSCYKQTVLLSEGEDPASLTTAFCERALENKPLGKKQEVAALHNLGVIQMAKGDSLAARASLEQAVSKSSNVGTSHLILAQLVHKQGDFTYAVELYDSLLSSNMRKSGLHDHKAVIEKNRMAAVRAQENKSYVLNQ